MKNTHYSWRQQYTWRLVPFTLFLLIGQRTARCWVHPHKEGGSQNEAGGIQTRNCTDSPSLNRKLKGTKKTNFQFTHTQTSSIHTTQVVHFFLNDFDFEKHWNKAIFEHCLPTRKHVLETKRDLATHQAAVFYFAYHVSFRSAQTHMKTKESLL